VSCRITTYVSIPDIDCMWNVGIFIIVRFVYDDYDVLFHYLLYHFSLM
jgi:hypothetical protein